MPWVARWWILSGKETRAFFYDGLLQPIDGHFTGPAPQFLAITHEECASGLFSEVFEALSDFTTIRTTSPFNGIGIWLEAFPGGR